MTLYTVLAAPTLPSRLIQKYLRQLIKNSRSRKAYSNKSFAITFTLQSQQY